MVVHQRLNIDFVNIVVNGDLATVVLTIIIFYHIVQRCGILCWE